MNKNKFITAAITCFSIILKTNFAIAATQNAAIGKLSAEWWQWALSIPPAENPMLDLKGSKCAVGQRGDTWFLAGVFGGDVGTATQPLIRTCSIPAGKKLFVPVINYVNFDTPNVCGQGASIPVKDLRKVAADFITGTTLKFFVLDGKKLKLTRAISPIFDITLQEDNVFDKPCTEAGNVPAGVYSPAVVDGYYVETPPLKAGKHRLRIRADHSSGSSIDVTYKLNVVPVNK